MLDSATAPHTTINIPANRTTVTITNQQTLVKTAIETVSLPPYPALPGLKHRPKRFSVAVGRRQRTKRITPNCVVKPTKL